MKSQLTKYINECSYKLKNIGIKTGNIINIKINDRATRRFGCCIIKDNGYEIEISKFILGDINKLTNTIYHELLHTVPGCFNHGNRWKQLVNKVNSAYSTNISRASSKIPETLKNEILKRAKYEVICKSCGTKIYRQRTSKLITHTDRYKCGKCEGELEVYVV